MRNADTIVLSAKSKRAKQVLADHGNRWVVLEKREKVLFSDLRGPWMLVAPDGRGCSTAHRRWVNARRDPRFVIEEISESQV